MTCGQRTAVVLVQNIEAGHHVLQDIVGHGDVIHHCNVATLRRAHREYDGKANLSTHPHILDGVTVEQDALGVFDLEGVLDVGNGVTHPG